jgi:outer membrane protein assembly factor BamB
MRRWLVSLAMVVVALPASSGLAIEVAQQKVTTTTAAPRLAVAAIETPLTEGLFAVKTSGNLMAIERSTGLVRWVRPTSSTGNTVAVGDSVVDAWVDREAHTFGLVRYDAKTGKQLDRVELGGTSGWYDYEHVELSPDGPGEVLVSAMFAIT